jgi:hypothetical protein
VNCHTNVVATDLIKEHSFELVWFGLFVHPFSCICNTGHINYRLKFTTQLIIYGHPNNTI